MPPRPTDSEVNVATIATPTLVAPIQLSPPTTSSESKTRIGVTILVFLLCLGLVITVTAAWIMFGTRRRRTSEGGEPKPISTTAPLNEKQMIVITADNDHKALPPLPEEAESVPSSSQKDDNQMGAPPTASTPSPENAISNPFTNTTLEETPGEGHASGRETERGPAQSFPALPLIRSPPPSRQARWRMTPASNVPILDRFSIARSVGSEVITPLPSFASDAPTIGSSPPPYSSRRTTVAKSFRASIHPIVG